MLVHCKITGLDPHVPSQRIELRWPNETSITPTVPLGPRGISAEAADLLDLAGAVLRIERLRRGNQRTNPAINYQLKIPFRTKGAQTTRAIELVQQALQLMGNATWDIQPVQSRVNRKIETATENTGPVNQVLLFSGGLDSCCGAAVFHPIKTLRLTSFYTHQKTRQREIADILGLPPPVQWRWTTRGLSGRGHTFYYRSFLFLCMAAATARSWDARELLQFENGVLAFSVPPAPLYLMTKHAHPSVQRIMEQLFTEILGGTWTVSNPALFQTKRQSFEAMKTALKPRHINPSALAARTESCWSFQQARVRGYKKRPGRHCGVCLPCLIRRTALDNDDYEFDIKSKKVRNQRLAIHLRCLLAFSDRILKANSPAAFYFLLDSLARDLVAPVGPYELEKIYDVYRQFAKEVRSTLK